MAKKSLLLISLLLMSCFLLPSVFATTSSNTVYNDIIWSNIPATTYSFFSLKKISQQSYFIIGTRNASTTSYLDVYLIDEYGVLQNTTTMPGTCMTGGSCSLGNNVNTYFMDDDETLLPLINNTASLLAVRFNTTDYLAGNGGLQIINPSVSLSTTNPNQDDSSISAPMNNQSYSSDTGFFWFGASDPVEVGNFTFAIAYRNGADYRVVWDFYDLSSHTLNIGTKKDISWATGLTNIVRFYVFPSESNCFWYNLGNGYNNDCIFQIVFEGASNQNSNRQGIYVREMRKGFIGYEFKDKGLLGFTTATGFENYVPNITYWTTTDQAVFLATNGRQLYYKLDSNDLTRNVYAQTFDLTWNLGANRQVNLNNSFMPNSKRFGTPDYRFIPTQVLPAQGNCSGYVYSMNNTQVDSNQNYLYFNNYLTFSSSSGGGPNPEAIYSLLRINITDSTNSANNSTYSIINTINLAKQLGPAYSDRGLTRIPTIGANAVNITVENIIYTYKSGGLNNFYCLGEAYGGNSAHFDILDNPTTETWDANANRKTTKFFVAEDILGSVEAYTVQVFHADGTFKSFYNNGPNTFGIQTVSAICICNDWVNGACFNTTHRVQSRTCVPSGCDMSTQFVPDGTCGVGSTTTTSTIPSCSAGFFCYNSTTSGYMNATTCQVTSNTTCGGGDQCCSFTGQCGLPASCVAPACVAGYYCDGNTRYYQNGSCDRTDLEVCPLTCVGGVCKDSGGTGTTCFPQWMCFNTSTKAHYNITCQTDGYATCPSVDWCNPATVNCESKDNGCVPFTCDTGQLKDYPTCSCKSTELDWSSMTTLAILQDSANGIKVLISKIAIPLSLIILAIGFGSIIMLIARRAWG